MADSQPHHDDHGHSVAAWVTVIVLIIASALMCVGVTISVNSWVIVGIVVAVLGLIAGKVLAVMGYGPHGRAGAAGRIGH